MFKLIIKTENAAFEEMPSVVARILMQLAKSMRDSTASEATGNLYDINGNFVGTYTLN